MQRRWHTPRPVCGCRILEADLARLHFHFSKNIPQAKPRSNTALSIRRSAKHIVYRISRSILGGPCHSDPGVLSPVISHAHMSCYREGRGTQSLSASRVSPVPLYAELREGLQRLGIRNLADVQRQCLIRILRGSSVAVAARPGAGKTLAYLLPMLQRFLNEYSKHAPDSGANFPFALMVVPSRELARQVMTVLTALLPQAPVLLLDPTAPLRQQQQQMQLFPAKLLIATPDRILALLRQPKNKDSSSTTQLSLEGLRMLVVDEADALVRRDYLSKVKAIYRSASGLAHEKAEKGDKLNAKGQRPKSTKDALQVLLFSAVLPQELLSIIETDFPHVTTLDLVSATAPSPHVGSLATAASGAAAADAATADCGDPARRSRRPAQRSHSAGLLLTSLPFSSMELDPAKLCAIAALKASRKCLGPSLRSFAVCVSCVPGVGAGVQRHICYVASRSAPDSLSTNSISLEKMAGAPKRIATRRARQTDEEAQLEKERKMLALAETLRTHIPTMARGGRGPSIDKSGNCFVGITRVPPKESEASPPPDTQTVRPDDAAPWVRAECTAGETAPQCIVFADSHNEALVLVCTDVAARGLDIPSVVLVVHMHPPSPPVNYTHRVTSGLRSLLMIETPRVAYRTGRAGRGQTPGTSVVLCSSVELHRQKNVERIGNIYFERRRLPAVAECQDLVLRQLTTDILNIPHAQYTPLLKRAQRLHAKVGAHAFATVLLKLGGKAAHSVPSLRSSDHQSTLSGRRGFVPLLLYDPTHERLESSMAARRFLQSLLPHEANAEVVGRVAKSANGYVVDVSETHVDHVIQQGLGRKNELGKQLSAGSSGGDAAGRKWVPVFHLDSLPRLLNQGIGRRKHGRKLPWTKMKLSVMRSKRQAIHAAAAKGRVLKEDMGRAQAMAVAQAMTKQV